MKKILLGICSFAFVSCLSAGFALNNPVEVAEAETNVFTETKCQISDNGDKMLVVTGITDVKVIYKLGYEINGTEYKADEDETAETTKYYTSLTLNGETKTAGEFIEGAEGLLIWEVAYNSSYAYTVQPYALVGELKDEVLIAPDNNQKTYGLEKTNFNVLSVAFKDENGETLKTESVNYGNTATAPNVQEKVGYTFDGWYNGADKIDLTEKVTGNLTLTAQYAPNGNTAYKVNVYKEKLMGGGYDLVETVNGEGTTDTNVSIENVEMPTMPNGFVVNAKTSVTEGTIAGDGTTELNVYWDYASVSTVYKTWTMWYDEGMATMGTNNYNDSVYASGVHFNTNSDKVYFSGQFVIDKWAFQGFSISSGDTYIRFMSRANGFNIWTMTYSNGNIVAENTENNTCLADKRNQSDSSSEILSPETINPISGSGTQKSWTFKLIIDNDIMKIYYEDVLCYNINLTSYGFTSGSNYNVGIVKPANFNTSFTVNSLELRTGSTVDEIVKELAK